MSAWTVVAFATLLGGGLGAGIWSALAALPRWSASPLDRRIAPYIRDITDAAGTTRVGVSADPASALGGAAAAVWSEVRARVAVLLGGAESIARRLEGAGLPRDVPAFRGRQLAWGIAGGAVGGVCVVALAFAWSLSPAVFALPVLLAATGVFAYDALLSARVKARAARIADELPTVLEFLVLCLAAGEGILDSVRRVADVGNGELTGELRRVIVEVGTGTPLPRALADLARRIDVPALGRTVDHLVAAIDRGAPLAQALQSQAGDSREEAKRALIEQAGKREIGMLVVLVFAILPLSVVFALVPGIAMLRVGF